jgi:Zn-dependent protease with chaperone function
MSGRLFPELPGGELGSYVPHYLYRRLSKGIELITDLRAVEQTGNRKAYIQVLEKLDRIEAENSPEIAAARKLWITRVFDGHPPTKERAQALLRVREF